MSVQPIWQLVQAKDQPSGKWPIEEQPSIVLRQTVGVPDFTSQSPVKLLMGQCFGNSADHSCWHYHSQTLDKATVGKYPTVGQAPANSSATNHKIKVSCMRHDT